VERWARKIVGNVSAPQVQMDFAMSSRAVEEIGLQFGSFNDLECRELKSTLLGIEAQKQGRVKLSAFYKMGLHTHWSFTEKVDYLRALGALDESDPEESYVIVPNYLSSRPQCLEASKFYAVCCRNECEDLLTHLEEKIGEPFALPETIVDLVSDLSSDTVSAPRHLSEGLVGKLQQIASTHGGHVPLHGRLFAQWMHHAFPRECPFPHEAGTTSPSTPDEWMRSTGQTSTQASEEEMVCHVTGPCSGGNGDAALSKEASAELPWSHAEELLVDADADGPTVAEPSEKQPEVAESSSSNVWLSMQMFNRLLRTLVLAGAALGLVLVSKLALPRADTHDGAPTKVQVKRSWATTLALFIFALLIVSMDYFFDFSTTNEFLACGLCWGLAAMLLFEMTRHGLFRQDSEKSARQGMVVQDSCLV